MKVLVTGATGYIGGRLVPRLLDAGHEVVCMARDPTRFEGRPWSPRVRRVAGDILIASSLKPALEGVDAAFYLVHSMAAGERGFSERDRVGAHHFAEVAAAVGLGRIVYLGGLGSSEAGLSAHLLSRHEVGDILRAGRVPVIELRAAVVVGSGSMSFEMIRYLTERLPVMITPRWVGVRCQPIAVRDVLTYLVESLTLPTAGGEVFEIGGPDVLTYGEMLEGYASARGLRRLLIPVPVLTPRLSSYWVDLVTPIPAAYARPLIEGLRHEVIVRDPAARGAFSVEPLPYRDAVRRAIERTEARDVETFWHGAAWRSGQGTPGVRLTTHEGMIIEERRVASVAPPETVFEVFAGVGGRRGWFYADAAWDLRGALDRLMGGPGMRRGRRHPNDLRSGDVVDFWRVEEVVPGRRVRLRAEMKVPGHAWLQFEAEPRPEGAQLVQTAFFDPRGLGGLAYWYALYPIHQLIFSGMARAIVRRAEARGDGG